MHADAAHPNPDVARRLERIYALHRTDIALRLGASPYVALLEKLGSPHLKIPPAVHVAGTNGKGSTIAFLRAMLEADGKKVHVYTSPHLLTFNERIRIAGKLIGDEYLIELYDRIERANEGAPITFFEFTTAMAFVAFAENSADYTLLEVGMGGRLDCTNVIEKPIATAITKISFDHTEFLGTTLEAIANEKAGIMKPGMPCVIGAQMDTAAVMPVFLSKGAPLVIAKMPDGYPKPNLEGAHQIENAATALALADILHVSENAKRHGLTSADWPGRLQHITQGPIATLLPPQMELWFDAAHNDSGALALAGQLQTWKKNDPACPIHLIAGMGADKDAKAFFDALSGLYDSVTFVDLTAARRPSTAARTRAQAGLLPLTDCYEKSNIYEAVRNIVEKAEKPNSRLVICGSLYLYGQIFDPNP